MVRRALQLFLAALLLCPPSALAATRLNGSGSWQVASHTDFDTDYFTIRVYFRQDAGNKGTQRLVSRQGATFWILWLINGTIKIETNFDGGIQGATDYSDGLWHEVVFTRAAGNGGWIKAYVDSALHLNKATNDANFINPNAVISIGGANNFIGDLDHLSYETAIAEDNPELSGLRSDRFRVHGTNQYTALSLDFWDVTVPTTVYDRSRLHHNATQSGSGFSQADGNPKLTASRGGE